MTSIRIPFATHKFFAALVQYSQIKLSQIRRGALIETLLFLTAIVSFNLAFGDGTRYISATFHPFWIIILLVSVQYGPNEGLVAALLSSTFLIVGNLPEQSFSETIYDYILRVSMAPLMWIMTAVGIGFIRVRQINERQDLMEKLSRAQETSASIVENYTVVKKSKERLELRLVEEQSSVLTMYEIAKSLETLEPFEASAGIKKLITVALKPKKFSLYIWKNNKLILESAQGWSSKDRFAKTFDKKSPLAQQIVSKNRIVSVVNKGDDVILDSQGMLAGPLIDEDTGELFGMLKIEEIGFTDIGLRTHETFRIVCAWISRVNANIEAYQEAMGITKTFNTKLTTDVKSKPASVNLRSGTL